MKTNFTNPVTEQVYQYLIDMILAMEIHPGDKIPEASIAQKFNISRTPIREAIRELASDGIIEISPNKAAKVAMYDDKRVRDIGITRTSLERLAVKLAIYYGSRADYQELRNSVERCYQAAIASNQAERIKADIEFHMGLAQISQNQELIQMERTLMLKLEFLQAANYMRAEDPKDQYDSHMAVIRALENNDIESGLAAITVPNIRFYGLTNIPIEVLY